METFSSWIETELNDKGWKPADLARAAGVTDATLSRVLSGSRNPGPELCRGIAKALGEPEEKVFRLAGLLSPLPTGEDATIQEIIELARTLPPDEQQAVVQFIRFIILQKKRRG